METPKLNLHDINETIKIKSPRPPPMYAAKAVQALTSAADTRLPLIITRPANGNYNLITDWRLVIPIPFAASFKLGSTPLIPK